MSHKVTIVKDTRKNNSRPLRRLRLDDEHELNVASVNVDWDFNPAREGIGAGVALVTVRIVASDVDIVEDTDEVEDES